MSLQRGIVGLRPEAELEAAQSQAAAADSDIPKDSQGASSAANPESDKAENKRTPERENIINTDGEHPNLRSCNYDGTDYPSWLGFDPFKKVDDQFTFPFPAAQGDPWENTAKMVKQYDDAMCNAWVDEIQNILIFSGLFSAVVTAFTVETQKLLQADPAVATVLLLAHLSTQMGANQTVTNIFAEPFQDSNDPTQSFRINALIFVSLVLSLGTALVCILSLQWIRSYRKMDSLSHQDQICIRHGRRRALFTWRVPDIITALPLIMQLSLVVFFAGLIDFLQSLNSPMVIVVASVIAVILAFVLFTTLIPGIYVMARFGKKGPLETVPAYQSPQSWLFFLLLRLPFKYIDSLAHYLKMKCPLEILHWSDLFARADHSYSHLLDISFDWLFCHFNDNESFCNLYHCFQTLTNKQMEWVVVELCMRSPDVRYDQDIPKALSFDPSLERPYLSLLLLDWDRTRHPSRPAVDLHKLELSMRVMHYQILGRSERDGAIAPSRSPAWKERPSVYAFVYASPEATEIKGYLFTFMVALQTNDISHYYAYHHFSFFWQGVLQLHKRKFPHIVDDCLSVLCDWLEDQIAAPGDLWQKKRVSGAVMGLLSVTKTAAYSSPEVLSIFELPSFLKFLSIFKDDEYLREFWRAVPSLPGESGIPLRPALRQEVEQKWDLHLAESSLYPAYFALGFNPARVAQFARKKKTPASAPQFIEPLIRQKCGQASNST
ncbi:hypothetical protein CVT24_005061 [Panaeolus cyanescens]|uniref:DUF6535 domain-containing protein n=1 Tax=Panaeolus cyanescens TaxID=181874 RepID=A0A409WVN7_9AGAR|nr:hypothetical protein CVT24_005061 [Panaeolus cyanescens]